MHETLYVHRTCTDVQISLWTQTLNLTGRQPLPILGAILGNFCPFFDICMHCISLYFLLATANVTFLHFHRSSLLAVLIQFIILYNKYILQIKKIKNCKIIRSRLFGIYFCRCACRAGLNKWTTLGRLYFLGPPPSLT